jgi:hypothetical protein
MTGNLVPKYFRANARPLAPSLKLTLLLAIALVGLRSVALAQDSSSNPPASSAHAILSPKIYDNGFFVSTPDKNFSLHVNGLFQIRYTGFKPSANVATFGESSAGTDTFDVYLGRVALSGSVFEPKLKYFLQVQGSTIGGSTGISLIDWFASYTASKYLTVQVGRSYTPYSYEYYDSPGNYLFADLSTAEYAFAIPRAIGVEAYGQAGKLSYAGFVANSVPALDGVAGQENTSTKLAYIGHLQLDVLAPYGYVETDPSGSAPKAELSLWGSGAYNPVESNSGLENLAAGDTTDNATSTVGYRYKLFSFQGTGYYRKTNSPTGFSTNSWGYGEQAGQYLIAKKLELAERISGVNFGAAYFPGSLTTTVPAPPNSSLAVSTTWYVGPGFSFHRAAEDTVGLNYYLYGHNAKVQLQYSYQYGNTFTGTKFSANRVYLQTQLMF